MNGDQRTSDCCLQREFLAISLPPCWAGLERLQASCEMNDRFEIGGTACGGPAGTQPIVHRFASEPGLREMQSDCLRLHLRTGRIKLFEGSGDTSMDLLPLAPQQTLMRDVLHQRMFEVNTQYAAVFHAGI